MTDPEKRVTDILVFGDRGFLSAVSRQLRWISEDICLFLTSRDSAARGVYNFNGLNAVILDEGNDDARTVLDGIRYCCVASMPKIVWCTAESRPEHLTGMRALGVDQFVRKPFDAKTLVAALKRGGVQL